MSSKSAQKGEIFLLGKFAEVAAPGQEENFFVKLIGLKNHLDCLDDENEE